MKKWKIGVIGVGGISQMHIQSYLHNPNVELYAFCDINEKRLQEMGRNTPSPACTPTRTKCSTPLPELDAVSVCTWNAAHAPLRDRRAQRR